MIIVLTAPKTIVTAAAPQFSRHERERDPMEIKQEKEQQKALNKERYDSLKKDTDQLLELSTELKKAVDAANENVLSVEVIRKTEEVEKLAKRVREKMKETFQTVHGPMDAMRP